TETATCYCARYQVQPTEKHLTTVKRIFRYLKDTIHVGLWYPKDTGFKLTAFLDSDHAGYLDQLESLNYTFDDKIAIGFILESLTSDFHGFVQNYNMQSMGKTLSEVHQMLIEYEKASTIKERASGKRRTVSPLQGGRTLEVELSDISSRVKKEEEWTNSTTKTVEMLQSTNLKTDSPDSEETFEDTEENQLKMRNKMIQLDYGKLNALFLPPKTAEEVVARERERKARTTLLMALPEDHFAKFHKMADAKWMWEAIKSRFGGNDKSKKMQKYLLKQQFEEVSKVPAFFLVSSGFDYGTKPGLDTLSFDDLNNNLRVFERDVKGTTASSSNTHNVMFVSAENTSSTNDVSTAYSVSSSSVLKSQKEGSSSYTNEVIHSFFVAMISMRIKMFHKRISRKFLFDTKDPVGFDKTKLKCFNGHKMRHFARDCRGKGNQDSRRIDDGYNGNKTRDNGRRPAYQDDSKALVTINGEDIDWSGHIEKDAQNYAMMAYSCSNSGFDNKSVFMNKESDLEDTLVNDRYADEMHAVPPPMIGNHMPFRPDVEIDYSKFSYGPKQTSADESNSKPSEYTSCDSDSSVETYRSMPEPVENASKVICEPKVWTDAPINEEYESDSNNDSVSNVQEDKEKPSFAFIDSVKHDDPHRALKDKGIIDSGCSRHMTRNKAHLVDYQEFKGGFIAFGGSNERITGKGKIKTGRLDFKDVYYVEELKHYNLFSMLQMCDKKNKVLFIDIDCLVLSFNFKLPDENQVLLKIPRQHNMYSFNLKNIDPSRDLACLFVKALIDESNKWHRRLGHVNCKNLNKLIKGNLFRGLPSKIFENDHTCVARQKGMQHKASCKAKTLSSVNQPLQILHMDLFGPTSVRSINHKTYYLVITDGFSRKSDLRFLVGYSLNSKAFRVYNLETKRVEENLHVNFLENKPNVARKGHAWMFDLDYLTNSMNYEPVSVKNQANKFAGLKEAINSACTQANDDQGANSREIDLNEEHFVLPICTPLSTAGPSRAFSDGELSYYDDPLMPHLEDIYASPSEGIFIDSSYDDEGVVTDFNNLETTNAFLYGTNDKEVYVSQPSGSVDPKFPNKVYKVVKALDGLHQAPRAWYATLSTFLVKSGYRRGAIDRTLFIKQDKNDIMLVKQKEDGIFISHDKYIVEILKKFDFLSVKTASTPIETQKPLVKDKEADDVNVHLYRFQVTPKTLHIHDVKRIFRKSTTGGCQFIGRRLILWQCKKQTIVAISTTEAEYVAATHCSTLVKRRVIESPFNDPLPDGEDSLKLKELMDLCTHLSNKVLELESEVIDTKSTYKDKNEKLEGRVDRLKEENRNLKDLYSVHSKVDIGVPVVEKEKSFKYGRIIADIDEDVVINLEEAQAKLYMIDLEHLEKVLSMQDVDDEEPADVEEVLEVVKAAKLITEVVTTAGAITTSEATKVSVPRRKRGVVIQDPEETTSTVGVHLEVQSKDKGKCILIEEPKSLKRQAQIEQDEAFARQLEAELNAYINWNAVMEQVKRSERSNDAVMKYQALKRKPLTEAQERKNMIIYLKNIAGYKMNYFKGMTYKALASKIPSVNYKIHFERNKPYFEIIRADTSIWRDKKGRYGLAKVKSWKLFELVGVHCITFSTTQMFLLVEKRYPLTHFTLEQMLNNVRLEVE
nr:putative ribonuclease H-like domain-containing protein [Tanacetum cinerariifolium]